MRQVHEHRREVRPGRGLAGCQPQRHAVHLVEGLRNLGYLADGSRVYGLRVERHALGADGTSPATTPICCRRRAK